MSIIKDTFFGGAEKKAAQAQQQGLEQAQRISQQAAAQARGDIMNLFPQAQQTGRQGFQQALDVFSQTLPQQTQAFTSGNVAAQNALLAGLPAMQSAILGTPSQPLDLQAFQFQPDLSFANQTLASLQNQEQNQGQANQTAPPTMQGNFLSGFGNVSFSPSHGSPTFSSMRM